MTRAVRDEILDQNKPVFHMQLESFSTPYMGKYHMMRDVLIEWSRNKLEESLTDDYLRARPDLTKMRLDAPMPPEVLEPLAAFRGDTNWSFDARTRLGQKLSGVDAALEGLHLTANSLPDPASPENAAGQRVTEVMSMLPEFNQKLNPAHPFRNSEGFRSVVPEDSFIGGVKAGMPGSPLKEELGGLRYPTLQRVAHSLPRDVRYKNNVVHSIRVLERSRGWDMASKLRAASTLKEVFDQLPSSRAIDRKLDSALPIAYQKGFGKPVRGMGYYRKGLRYIRSLTAVKGPAPRSKKK